MKTTEIGWMTEISAANYLCLSSRTLARYRHTGDGPRYRKGTGRMGGVRYHKRDLDQWADSRMATSTSFATEHLLSNQVNGVT